MGERQQLAQNEAVFVDGDGIRFAQCIANSRLGPETRARGQATSRTPE